MINQQILKEIDIVAIVAVVVRRTLEAVNKNKK